jgi:hypothetical protein
LRFVIGIDVPVPDRGSQRGLLLTFNNSIASLRGMDIREYLEKQDLSQKEFGDQIGVSQGLVWQWIEGRTRIDPKHFEKIEEVTDGKVTRQECRPDIFGERAPA